MAADRRPVSRVWPEYNLHGGDTNRYWDRLYDDLPDFQFVLYDDERDEVLAEGHTLPCAWDGTALGLGSGIDHIIASGFALREAEGKANALSAEVLPEHRDRGRSSVVLMAMAGLAASAVLEHLVAPVRPSWKVRRARASEGRQQLSDPHLPPPPPANRRLRAAHTKSGIEQMIRVRAEQAGLNKRVYPHMLPHSYATGALNHGMNPMMLAQVLDHSSLVLVYRNYAHWTPADAHEMPAANMPGSGWTGVLAESRWGALLPSAWEEPYGWAGMQGHL